MALTVETGSGSPTADSYNSVDEVTTHFDAFGITPTGWAALTTAVKEQHCRKATDYLDTKFQGRWRGSKAALDQALSWPRYGVLNDDGWAIDHNTVPAAIKKAHAELVARSVASGLNADITAPSGAIQSKRVKVGSIEIATAYQGGASQRPVYDVVIGLLKEFVVLGDRTERC